MTNPVLHCKKQWGGGGGGWGERTLGLSVKSFPPAFREKQHRNTFSHHTGRLATFGWILTYLKISVEMAVMWFVPGAFQFLTFSHIILRIPGEKGCGKSTIVSNWLKNLYSSHPHLVILPHYVACSSTSTNAAHLMRRCTSELRLHYLDSDHDYLNDTQEIVDFTRVTQAFKAALALGPSILVIDGVDQLGAAYECPTYKVLYALAQAPQLFVLQ